MKPDEPVAWISKGDEDLALVRDVLPKAVSYPNLVCYHCQQAAEKYLKALLLYHGQSIKKTHDLIELVKIVHGFDSAISADHYNHSLKITIYATQSRYPGLYTDPTEADILEALSAAEFFRAFASKTLCL